MTLPLAVQGRGGRAAHALGVQQRRGGGRRRGGARGAAALAGGARADGGTARRRAPRARLQGRRGAGSPQLCHYGVEGGVC